MVDKRGSLNVLSSLNKVKIKAGEFEIKLTKALNV